MLFYAEYHYMAYHSEILFRVMAVPVAETISAMFNLQAVSFCCLKLAEVTCLNDSKVFKVALVDSS